jgi:hypothetical protein
MPVFTLEALQARWGDALLVQGGATGSARSKPLPSDPGVIVGGQVARVL